MSKLSFTVWDEKQFVKNKNNWEQLLANSDCDPLFLSWQWQYAWWKNCGGQNPVLQIIAVYKAQQLIALAPFFTHEKTIKSLFKVKQLQFIGCSYEIGDAVRSDNLDFIVNRNGDHQAIGETIKLALISINWDQLIVDGVSRQSHVFHLIKSFKKRKSIQVLARTPNYIVRFTDSFDNFCRALKKKVRQKTILHRRFIEQDLDYRIVDNNDTERFFNDLNQLKMARWNKNVYQNNRLKFQLCFLDLCKETKAISLFSSTMRIENETQSAFYGFIAGEQIYFLQYAFNPEFNSKLSLGFLHLGYVIESGYQRQLNQLQLLPGGGQNDAYKQHLANKIQPQLTIRVLSSSWLQGLHWLLNKFK